MQMQKFKLQKLSYTWASGDRHTIYCVKLSNLLLIYQPFCTLVRAIL